MMDELPSGLRKYSESPIFDQTTVPEKLTTSHKTKETVWGKIVVHAGSLEYVIPGEHEQSRKVAAGESAIIEPAVEHYVKVDGEVTFQIEFYR